MECVGVRIYQKDFGNIFKKNPFLDNWIAQFIYLMD